MVKFLYLLSKSWLAPTLAMPPGNCTNGISPSRFSGNSSEMVRPRSLRVLVTLSP